MKQRLAVLAIAAIALFGAPVVTHAQAVLDFENVAADTWLTSYTEPYHLNGLRFVFVGYGQLQRVVDIAGNHRVVDYYSADPYGAEVRIFSATGQPFYFNSAEYGARPGGGGHAIRFTVYRNAGWWSSYETTPYTEGHTLTAAQLNVEGLDITELRINIVGNFYYDNLNVTLPSVRIGDCDTGVKDRLADVQLSIQQLISQKAAEAASHDDFMAYVAHLTNLLRKSQVINTDEVQAIRVCAAQSTIGECEP